MEPRITIKYLGEDLEMSLSEARKLWEQLDRIFSCTKNMDYLPAIPPTPYYDNRPISPCPKSPDLFPQFTCEGDNKKPSFPDNSTTDSPLR